MSVTVASLTAPRSLNEETQTLRDSPPRLATMPRSVMRIQRVADSAPARARVTRYSPGSCLLTYGSSETVVTTLRLCGARKAIFFRAIVVAVRVPVVVGEEMEDVVAVDAVDGQHGLVDVDRLDGHRLEAARREKHPFALEVEAG